MAVARMKCVQERAGSPAGAVACLGLLAGLGLRLFGGWRDGWDEARMLVGIVGGMQWGGQTGHQSWVVESSAIAQGLASAFCRGGALLEWLALLLCAGWVDGGAVAGGPQKGAHGEQRHHAGPTGCGLPGGDRTPPTPLPPALGTLSPHVSALQYQSWNLNPRPQMRSAFPAADTRTTASVVPLLQENVLPSMQLVQHSVQQAVSWQPLWPTDSVALLGCKPQKVWLCGWVIWRLLTWWPAAGSATTLRKRMRSTGCAQWCVCCCCCFALTLFAGYPRCPRPAPGTSVVCTRSRSLCSSLPHAL